MIFYVIIEPTKNKNKSNFFILKFYLLVQDIKEHVEWQYFVVVHRLMDKAYYDVDVHLVNDFYQVVLEQ